MQIARLPSLILASLALLAVFSAAHAQEAACPTPGVAAPKPIAETRSKPPYPEMSKMTGEAGNTLLEVLIGTDGVPVDAQVVETSGSIRLDEAARDHVKSVWRWAPPQRDCRPIQIRTRVEVVWNLIDAPEDQTPKVPALTMRKSDYPPGALARLEQGVTSVSLVVLEEGGIDLVQVQKGSGFSELDAKALEIVKTRYRWQPARMDSKPINTVVLVAVIWQLDSSQPPAGR